MKNAAIRSGAVSWVARAGCMFRFAHFALGQLVLRWEPEHPYC